MHNLLSYGGQELHPLCGYACECANPFRHAHIIFMHNVPEVVVKVTVLFVWFFQYHPNGESSKHSKRDVPGDGICEAHEGARNEINHHSNGICKMKKEDYA